ncbi:malate synthase [Actinomycetes bacterium]|nr:malate synthase [Actinomycetes bacterium]
MSVAGVIVSGPAVAGSETILTEKSLELVALLHRNFNARRLELLAARTQRMERIAAGDDLKFLEETKSVREDSSWKVAPAPKALQDRRVEITGPTDRKMTINALNSGAKVWLADQEDANTPLWENVIGGQVNLRASITREIDFTSEAGKTYSLRPDNELAVIVMRPRGLHLPEKHITVDGEVTSGSFVDFALYMAASAQLQINRGQGPYFYLAKLESHLEVRLWNDIFNAAQDFLAIPRGTIRATILIETFPAAFEMEEFLYELKDHCAGLNAGRWDFMFSVIKNYRTRGKDFVLPDRNSVLMTVPFMRAYTELLVRTCHKRGAHAIGGMAAFIPSSDPAINETAFAKVSADKAREANDGFDGSWVAHPGMVEICRQEFTKVLGNKPNQKDKLREDVNVSAADLLNIKATPGSVTEAGLRNNISVSIQYLEKWLKGSGAVAIFNLMEDAATAEISRSQIWQWIHNEIALEDGTKITPDLVERLADEEIAKLPNDSSKFVRARENFLAVCVSQEYVDFLTLPAYAQMP